MVVIRLLILSMNFAMEPGRVGVTGSHTCHAAGRGKRSKIQGCCHELLLAVILSDTVLGHVSVRTHYRCTVRTIHD